MDLDKIDINNNRRYEKKKRIGNITEAPTWTIDNHYIYSGY